MDHYSRKANDKVLNVELSTNNYRNHLIQICSGITRGRVLSGELYAQRLQKLCNLQLFTACFYEDFTP